MNPGHAGVIEAEADLLAMQHRTAEAMKLYKIALDKDPGNAAIEKKYALLVFQKAEVTRMADGMVSDYEPNVSPYAMILLSVVPGLGQMVAGQFKKGLTILLVFLVSVVWIILTPGGISGLFGGSEFNPIVLVPALIAIGCYFYAFADASSIAQRQRKLEKPKERKRPPVDLPYD
jgi:TM2 domain-containing membrane protein YozV